MKPSRANYDMIATGQFSKPGPWSKILFAPFMQIRKNSNFPEHSTETPNGDFSPY